MMSSAGLEEFAQSHMFLLFLFVYIYSHDVAVILSITCVYKRGF